MTIPNTYVNGTVIDADEHNENINYVNPVWDIEFVNASTFSGIIAHSTTNYSLTNAGGGTIYLWDGSTFTSKNSTPNQAGILRLCKDDDAKGFFVELVATGETSYGTGDGTSWAVTANVGHSITVNDMSFPTANLIVIGGDDGGGDFIQTSVDQGANWVDATTSPAAAVEILDMFDGTTGYCIDASDNIWKTTDSGDTWVDTTDNISNSHASGTMFCLTADIVLICSEGYVHHYTNSTNTLTTKFYDPGQPYPSNFVNTNGYIYLLIRTSSGGDPQKLLISSDSGVTWTEQPASRSAGGTSDYYKSMLAAYDTGKIMFVNTGQIYKQDRSNL